MTMLDDKTDLRLINVCQKAYLEMEECTYSELSCTQDDDLQITQSINNLRGVVQTWFSIKRNRNTIEQELSEFYDQIPVHSDHMPWNDLFCRELLLSCGLKLLVSPRDINIKYKVV